MRNPVRRPREGRPLACVATLPLALSWLLVATSVPAHAQASFDCKKARSPVEKAICRDRTLSDLDRKIAAAYSTALKGLDPVTAGHLREDQRLFVASRDAAFGATDFSLREFLEYRATQLESVETRPRRGFAGAWITFGGSITVGAGDKGLEVSISTSDGTVGRWLCDFAGVAREDGPALIVEEPPEDAAYDGWTVRLTRSGNAVKAEAIRPEGSNDRSPPFCGANGSVDGTFVAARVGD